MIDKFKRDTLENWNKAINFIPKKDEIILYDCENGPKMKVGDGITKVIDLPFTDNVGIANISGGESVVEDDILIIK